MPDLIGPHARAFHDIGPQLRARLDARGCFSDVARDAHNRHRPYWLDGHEDSNLHIPEHISTFGSAYLNSSDRGSEMKRLRLDSATTFLRMGSPAVPTAAHAFRPA